MRDKRDDRDSRWARLKVFGGAVIVAFAVTLALVVGNRLSEEALGVLAGAVCGVGAAIPTSLIVVAVSKWQGESRPSGRPRAQQREVEYEGRRAYPPVVVVSPGHAGHAQQPSRGSWNTLPASLSAPVERSFRIVGGAAMDREGVRYDDERGA